MTDTRAAKIKNDVVVHLGDRVNTPEGPGVISWIAPDSSDENPTTRFTVMLDTFDRDGQKYALWPAHYCIEAA